MSSAAVQKWKCTFHRTCRHSDALDGTLEPLLRGDKMVQDQLTILFRQVQTTKAAKAQELLAKAQSDQGRNSHANSSTMGQKRRSSGRHVAISTRSEHSFLSSLQQAFLSTCAFNLACRRSNVITAVLLAERTAGLTHSASKYECCMFQTANRRAAPRLKRMCSLAPRRNLEVSRCH